MRVNSSTFFLQHYCHFCPFHNFQSSPLIKLILLSINLSSEKAGEQKAALDQPWAILKNRPHIQHIFTEFRKAETRHY